MGILSLLNAHLLGFSVFVGQNKKTEDLTSSSEEFSDVL